MVKASHTLLLKRSLPIVHSTNVVSMAKKCVVTFNRQTFPAHSVIGSLPFKNLVSEFSVKTTLWVKPINEIRFVTVNRKFMTLSNQTSALEYVT